MICQTSRLNKSANCSPNSCSAKNRQPVSAASLAPLSFAQQRLWFINQLQPEETVYTIPAALRLQGDLSINILKRCLNTIVARHEILRTQFVAGENAPVQKVLPQLEIQLPVIELAPSETAFQNLGAFVRPHLQALVAQPFDLEIGPLLRCQLFKLTANDHILAVTIHHIIADYWSLTLLMKEIAMLYPAFASHRPLPLPELAIQYGDYAVWQRDQSSESQRKLQLEYWQQQLAAPPALLQLPTDFSRPAVQSFRGARHGFTLSPTLSVALSQLAQQSQATLFMLLLAAFQVLLYRYSGQTDILVGSTVSNRDRAETKDLIGLFVNNLVFRAQITPTQPFNQFLQQVKTTALAAYSHKDVPFEQVVDALKIERQLSYNALFQTMFILHNTPTANVTLPDLTITPLKPRKQCCSFRHQLGYVREQSRLNRRIRIQH